MKRRFRAIIVLCLTLMMAIGSIATVNAQVYFHLYTEVIDSDQQPAEGIVMQLGRSGYESEIWTTDETGFHDINLKPGDYFLLEMGYSKGQRVYNDMWFEITDEPAFVFKKGNAEYKLVGENLLVWQRFPYEDYNITVALDNSQLTGSRVELVDGEGTCLNSWVLEEEGDLVADLKPGSYTLKEIVEINGYEMPILSNIMVGGDVVIPDDADAEFYYDKFQDWLEGQTY